MTAFWAAKSKSSSGIIFKPLLRIISLANSIFVPFCKYKKNNKTIAIIYFSKYLSNKPCSRTIRGTLTSIDLQALTIPLAMVAQLTIPPKIFTKIALTCLSDVKISNASLTWVSVTFPPQSLQHQSIIIEKKSTKF